MVTVHASSEGLLRKPDLKRPDAAPKLFSDAPEASTSAPSTSAPTSTPSSSSSASGVAPRVVTIEYQRQRAKEMRKYFQDLDVDKKVADSQLFGWTPSNELLNGRWVMFGWAVGLLTEYATGVDFIEQLKLILTYTGIADLDS